MGAEMGDEIVQRRDVGQVAASLARDAQFAGGAVHFFEEQRVGPLRGGLAGGHQPGRACSDDDYLTSCHTPSMQ